MIDGAKSTIGNGCITDNTLILIAWNFYPKSLIDKIMDEKECLLHLQYMNIEHMKHYSKIHTSSATPKCFWYTSCVPSNKSVHCMAQTQNQWGRIQYCWRRPSRIWKDLTWREYERMLLAENMKGGQLGEYENNPIRDSKSQPPSPCPDWQKVLISRFQLNIFFEW